MTNLDPSLPGQHADLIDGKGKATPWFRRWLERADAKLVRVEAAAASAAAAAAAIPAAAPSPVIHGINGIDVSGSPTTDWTISGASIAQAQASQASVPGRDGQDGEDSYIPGPAGAAGVAGAPGPVMPTLMSANFAVVANTQALFTLPIEVGTFDLDIAGDLVEVF